MYFVINFIRENNYLGKRIKENGFGIFIFVKYDHSVKRTGTGLLDLTRPY